MTIRTRSYEDHPDAHVAIEGDAGGGSLRRFKAHVRKEGFAIAEGWKPKTGYTYVVVRAISARINQNFDGWPSEELKKTSHLWLGKPVFVNHENHDPSKARGVVVASRYREKDNDKFIECVMEVDGQRFPKLAHEIKTGGLDSVSMGAEAGFTICSYCKNKATDTHDMCDHVLFHKGEKLSRLNRKTGKREEVLVYESCHKLSWFELSFVFEPADETAVASKVLTAAIAAGDNRFAKNNGRRAKQWELPKEKRGTTRLSSNWDHSEGHSQAMMGDGHSLHTYSPHKSDTIFDEYGVPSIAPTGSARHEWVHTHGGEPVNGGFADSHANAMAQAENSHKDLTQGWDADNDPFDPRQFGAGLLGDVGALITDTATSGQEDDSFHGAGPMSPAASEAASAAQAMGKRVAHRRHAGECLPGQPCLNIDDVKHGLPSTAYPSGGGGGGGGGGSAGGGGGVSVGGGAIPGSQPGGGAPSGDLIHELQRAGINPSMYNTISGFSATEGNAPDGAPTLGFTDSQAGTGLPAHVDALAKQIKDRASVTGDFPTSGSASDQAGWMATLVGQNGSKSDWQGNAQPARSDYINNIVKSMPTTAPAQTAPTAPAATVSQPATKAARFEAAVLRTAGFKTVDLRVAGIAEDFHQWVDNTEGAEHDNPTHTEPFLMQRPHSPGEANELFAHMRMDPEDADWVREGLGHPSPDFSDPRMGNIKTFEKHVLRTAGFKTATKCHYCKGDAEEGRKSCPAHAKMEDAKYKAAVLRDAGFRDWLKGPDMGPGDPNEWTHDPATNSYSHPSGHEIRPSDEKPGSYQLWAPTVSMGTGNGRPAKDRGPSPDLQSHFDRVQRTGALEKMDKFAPADETVPPKDFGPVTVTDKQLTKIRKGDQPGKDEVESNTGDGSDASGKIAAAFESRVLKAFRIVGELPPAENSQATQRPGTMGTYKKVHQYFDKAGAPTDGVLDYGAGLGHSGEFGHTYEPHPREGFEPTYRRPEDVPEAAHGRVTNLNVLNVVPPHIRDQIVDGIGRTMAPGGHAVITTRGRDVYDATNQTPVEGDDGPLGGGVIINKGRKNETYQKGFHPDELHSYVQSRLGDGYTVKKVPIGPAGVHIVRNASNTFEARVKRAYGEEEAPTRVNTLREEGSDPQDDSNDFYHYVEPPKDLQTPDLSQAGQIDREQQEQPQPAQMPPEGQQAPPQQPGPPMITMQIPMVADPPQVPMQQGAPPPQGPPQQIAASTLTYFDRYFGRRIANWQDAVGANRGFTPEEAADYRREATRQSNLSNKSAGSTTNRKHVKGTPNMGRSTLASRGKAVTASRRRHFAEGPLVDTGDQSRNNQGEQEDAFISETPPAEPAVTPKDGQEISNTENNLVARVQRGRNQLIRDANALANHRRRQADVGEAGGPTPDRVDPRVNSGPGARELAEEPDTISADPNEGLVETQPDDASREASLQAFRSFDEWLTASTGKSSRHHTSATIRRAADDFSRKAGISVQALFPALGIVLREARKTEKKANTKGAKMRKRADDKLEVAAPDGRIDVEAPTEGTTDAEAQASQFDLGDFGDNAGDNIADPDLSTDQNWAPGEAKKQSSRVKTAGGILAFRCAEAMIAAGLEPNTVERKYALAAAFENMNRGLVQDRTALCERFAGILQDTRRQVPSGNIRGAALRPPVPSGLQGAQRTAGMNRVAANDPSNDSSLFI